MEFLKYFSVFFFIGGVFSGIVPPPPGDQCIPPVEGLGLGAAVRELVDLLPYVEMATIYLNAVTNDDEVMAAMEYLESDDFKKIVQVMQNTPEFSEIMEYLCEELYFDAYFYLNTLGDLMDYPQMTRPPPNYHQQNTRYRPGFNGFLEDLRDAMPMDELRRVYRERFDTDEFLRLAMEKIGSDDFRRIGDAIEALPEYQNMLIRLREIGVDVDKILDVLMDFFNWHPRP